MRKSHPAWGAWIEIHYQHTMKVRMKSHPAWGAWIEIRRKANAADAPKVAPRMGCVD